jgi:hypothetical protein
MKRRGRELNAEALRTQMKEKEKRVHHRVSRGEPR